jgi:hypothetical protein
LLLLLLLLLPYVSFAARSIVTPFLPPYSIAPPLAAFVVEKLNRNR